MGQHVNHGCVVLVGWEEHEGQADDCFHEFKPQQRVFAVVHCRLWVARPSTTATGERIPCSVQQAAAHDRTLVSAFESVKQASSSVPLARCPAPQSLRNSVAIDAPHMSGQGYP